MQWQMMNARLEQVVEDCARNVGKSHVSPFRFKVDFIFWPDDYRRQVSEAHLVLGVAYLDQERVDLLRTTLKDCIIKLM